MSDALLFERFPEWLGQNFLPALVILALGLVAFVLGALHFARWTLIRKKFDAVSDAVSGPMSRLLNQQPRIAAFFGNLYSPEYRIVRYLLVGLVLSGASLYGFIGLLDELAELEELERFDRTLAASVRMHAWQPATSVFEGITWLANRLVIAGLGMLVGLVLLARRRWILFIAWAGALAGSALLNLALKAAIERRRPELESSIYAEGWSFPSGHVMGATTAYGMLAYIATRTLRFPMPYLSATVSATVSVILLIGASRIYLGVHYFSDVAGGFLAGTVWLVICISGCEFATARADTRDTRVGPR